jgi:hypothetical protein
MLQPPPLGGAHGLVTLDCLQTQPCSQFDKSLDLR